MDSRTGSMRRRGLAIALCGVILPAGIFAGDWIDDGNDRPPRLSVEQAIWAMGGLPRGEPEWTLEQKVAKIAAAPFDGFMVFLPRGEEKRVLYRDLARKHELALTLQCAPATVRDLEQALDAAKLMQARGLVAMIRPTFVTHEEGAGKIRGMMAAARQVGVPFYVETHRGSITQDLLLTERWVREIPDIQVHADLSHFVISYEIGRAPDGRIKRAFDTILTRTGMLDGRIGNGEQVQIDIGPKGDHPQAALFVGWWKQAMRNWLKQAGKGDVFVFKSELGPPAYSIVGADGRELSDRWAQALVVRNLGIGAWNEVVEETGRGQAYATHLAAAPQKSPPKPPKPAPAPKPAPKKRPEPAAAGKIGKIPDLKPVESKIRVIRGVSHQVGDFYLSGQPAQPDLELAKELGVKTVVNLRMKKEMYGLGFEEDVALKFIDVKYIHLPTAPDTIDDKHVEKFLAALEKEKKPMLIHDSNGNRVWGMWAIYLATKYGIPIDQTKKQAASIGVKKLVVEDFARKYVAKRKK